MCIHNQQYFSLETNPKDPLPWTQFSLHHSAVIALLSFSANPLKQVLLVCWHLISVSSPPIYSYTHVSLASVPTSLQNALSKSPSTPGCQIPRTQDTLCLPLTGYAGPRRHVTYQPTPPPWNIFLPRLLWPYSPLAGPYLLDTFHVRVICSHPDSGLSSLPALSL